MSDAALGKRVRTIVNNVLKDKRRRKKLDTLVTTMEISPDVMVRNFNVSQSQGKKLAKALIDAIVQSSTIAQLGADTGKTFSRTSKRSGIFYPKGVQGNTALVVAPSFGALSEILKKASRHSSLTGTILAAQENERGVEVRPFDIGHTSTFGGQQTEQGRILKRGTVFSETVVDVKRRLSRKGLELDKSFAHTKLSNLFEKTLNELHEIHMPYTVSSDLHVQAFKKGGILKNFTFVSTVPQANYINQEEIGDLETQLYREFTESIEEVILDLESSPSVRKVFNDTIDDAFYQRKPTHTKDYEASVKGSIDTKVGKAVVANTALKSQKLRNSKGQFLNPVTLKNLMNNQLHDYIKANMGKGAATQILNYRTGRFAKSAEIRNIAQVDEKVLVDYSYMRDPYDVFRPGGKLYKPGRDPEKIINKSIRQLATTLVSKRFKTIPRLV